jgi:hypothetical protein
MGRTKNPTPRQRKFTNEYRLGERMYIIRSEHGWHDGSIQGNITHLSENSCTITSDQGILYEINHPRDISKMQ